jgi:hypothetical protein
MSLVDVVSRCTPRDCPIFDLQSLMLMSYLIMHRIATRALFRMVAEQRGQHCHVMLPERRSRSVWTTLSEILSVHVKKSILINWCT